MMMNIESKELTQSRSSLLRTYKDSVFRMLFNSEENALKLYNALTGKEFPETVNLRFTTLKEVVYKTKKNDISFLLDDVFIILLEHQSTLNVNMVTRDLIYYTTTIQRLFTNRAFYKETMIPLPRPEFIILYNGTEDMPDYQEMRLSDNYESKGEINLELKVKIYNINEGRNPEIMEKCKLLKEYSQFVSVVREATKRGELSDTDLRDLFQMCIENGILPEFLKTYGTEVISMLFEELTEEEARELAREDGFEVGLREGTKVGIEQGIQQGVERINQLNSILIESGRIEELKKAAGDTAYQEMLCEELGI